MQRWPERMFTLNNEVLRELELLTEAGNEEFEKNRLPEVPTDQLPGNFRSVIRDLSINLAYTTHVFLLCFG